MHSKKSNSIIFCFMQTVNSSGNFDARTTWVYDDESKTLLCYLEHKIPLDGNFYALLTPVDTPVCLFRFYGDNDPELISATTDPSLHDSILSVADAILEEHDLILVRSAVSLTVSGDLNEAERDDVEADDEEFDDDDELDDDDSAESETYELLASFIFEDQEYGLYIPLDPFFIVARLSDNRAQLVEGEEFDQVQSRIEFELARRGLLN
uniref:DUF3727 domain-containing protein n=1 Tax=Paulinella micropora TaxID=1928728 RepID=A0A385HZF2_9EUKA|nr:hypothetical protein PMNZ_066 [Paulinella micropora]AXY63029.1 hypothetical protein PMNZ_066 [Paulinella micropora]